MRYFIELSYNGTQYHGWQRQPSVISVQEVLENVLSKMLREEISIVGAGRTDAGVHASQMFAHLNVSEEKNITKDDFLHKINSFLPEDIAVHKIFEVNDTAHARFDAIARSYEYKICTKKNVFNKHLQWQIIKPLDVEKMNEAAKILLNYTDFQCFSKVKTDVKTFNCDVREAVWKQNGENLTFHITADRFLRNMVRAIVGTLIEIGQGKKSVNNMKEIIESKDRKEAGYSVPAHALYLTSVVYPKTIFNG